MKTRIGILAAILTVALGLGGVREETRTGASRGRGQGPGSATEAAAKEKEAAAITRPRGVHLRLSG